MAGVRMLFALLLLAVALPVAAAEEYASSLSDGVDGFDDVIVVTGALAQEVDPAAESPVDGANPPGGGPTIEAVGSAYFNIPNVAGFDPPTINADSPLAFAYLPPDDSFFEGAVGFAAHAMILGNVNPDTGWRDLPYFEAAVFLTRQGQPSFEGQPGIDNDPGTGTTEASSFLAEVSQLRAVFVRPDGLFASPYLVAVTPLGGDRVQVTHIVPDATALPRFVTSFAEQRTGPGDITFYRVDGEAPGFENPYNDIDDYTTLGVEWENRWLLPLDTGQDEIAPPDEPAETTESSDVAPSTTESDVDTSRTQDQPPAQEAADETSGGPAADGDGLSIVVIGGLVVLVLMIGGVAWYFLFNRDRSQGAGGDSQPGGVGSSTTDAPTIDGAEPSGPGPLMGPVDELVGLGEGFGLPFVDGWQQVPYAEVREAKLWIPLGFSDWPDPGEYAFWVKDGEVHLGTTASPPVEDGPGFRVPRPADEPPPVEEGTAMLAGVDEANLLHQPGGEDPAPVEENSDPPRPPDPADEGEPWWGDGAPPVGGRPKPPTVTSDPGLTPDNDPFGVLDGLDQVDMTPRPATIDLGAGSSGTEAAALQRLRDIVERFRGTGDIAGVAEALYEFDQWHLAEHGERWFEWTNDAGPSSLSGRQHTVSGFLTARRMSCYEFVHFSAFLASDQLARPVMDPQRKGVQVDERPVWGAFERVFPTHLAQPVDGDAPLARGTLVTGVALNNKVNKAGYTHIVISLGDGQVVSLGSGDLVKESFDSAFRFYYGETLQMGSYGYGAQNPAPEDPIR